MVTQTQARAGLATCAPGRVLVPKLVVKPKLVVEPNQSSGRRPARSGVAGLWGAELKYFVGLLVGGAEGAAEGYVRDQMREGRSPGSLYLGLMTDAARQLGVLWEDDDASFVEVTLAAGRIQRLVGRMRPELEDEPVSA